MRPDPGSITPLQAHRYDKERFLSLKGDRAVYAVFSTIGEREADLVNRKIALLSGELDGCLDGIFLSHRRRNPRHGDLTESRALEAWNGTVILPAHDTKVPDMGDERGKGADMRRALYRINRHHRRGKSEDRIVIVFLDADVVTEYFGTHFVLGLAGPVLEGYDFAKAGFHRAMGRVKKFVAQPLFSAISHPKLDLLRELSYPLSGEAAGTLAFFNGVNFWQMYGVETGIDVDSCMGGCRIADVNLGHYDHQHHDDPAIQAMAFGVIRTYLTRLMEHGILELKDGARISDLFAATSIDRHGSRERIEVPLDEIRYRPLRSVLETEGKEEGDEDLDGTGG
ncbi:MAG: hypothetical protein JXA20_09865 [Spirochaetes bacterium]|nr:hypothetical protein [Spirochaetota bacterium]